MDRSEAAELRETKSTELGMVERGGRVRARVIASQRGAPLSRGIHTRSPSAKLSVIIRSLSGSAKDAFPVLALRHRNLDRLVRFAVLILTFGLRGLSKLRVVFVGHAARG